MAARRDIAVATDSVTRRKFIGVAALSSAAFTPLAATLDGDRTAEEMKAEKIISMLNGATQRSYTDPFDMTSPPSP
jgi:hypothetical protein